MSNDGYISGSSSTIDTGASACTGGLLQDCSVVIVALGEIVIDAEISLGNIYRFWTSSTMNGTITGQKTGELPPCRVITSSLAWVLCGCNMGKFKTFCDRTDYDDWRNYFSRSLRLQYIE